MPRMTYEAPTSAGYVETKSRFNAMAIILIFNVITMLLTGIAVAGLIWWALIQASDQSAPATDQYGCLINLPAGQPDPICDPAEPSGTE